VPRNASRGRATPDGGRTSGNAPVDQFIEYGIVTLTLLGGIHFLTPAPVGLTAARYAPVT
jgi:hypothetical protein